MEVYRVLKNRLLSAELDVIKDFYLSGVDFLTPRRGVNFIG